MCKIPKPRKSTGFLSRKQHGLASDGKASGVCLTMRKAFSSMRLCCHDSGGAATVDCNAGHVFRKDGKTHDGSSGILAICTIGNSIGSYVASDRWLRLAGIAKSWRIIRSSGE